jgi:hypothetical protein
MAAEGNVYSALHNILRAVHPVFMEKKVATCIPFQWMVISFRNHVASINNHIAKVKI